MLNRREIAGALGDLGVLFPLSIALITLNHMNPTSVLLVVGLLYMGSALYFRLPIPVQPLKAVAMIALAMGAGPPVIMAAGILMGAILFLLALSRFCNSLGRIFTKPIVRGIQLGVGLLLLKKGITLLIAPHILSDQEAVYISLVGYSVSFSLIVSLIGGGIIIGLMKNSRFPASLVVIVFGIVIGMLFGSLDLLHGMRLGPVLPTFYFPSSADFSTAFFLMVIPQIPLTFGNAIVAMADVSKRYFGEEARRVSPRALCTSLGLANLAGSLIGGMPVCHGAGGMTAHYRFGARTGGSTLFLGILLVTTGLLFGHSAVSLMAMIPLSILGVLLVYVGIEHGLLIRDLVGKRVEMFIALLIGILSLVTGNIFYGFATGMVVLLLTEHLPSAILGGAKGSGGSRLIR